MYNPRTFMPVLDVLIYPDPVLRQATRRITVFDEKLKNLLENMFETMDAYKGVGLAAPQIGVLEKIIVVSYEERSLALINPEIIFHEGETIDEEGCLSLPEVTMQLKRFDIIKVKAQDFEGNPVLLDEHGFFSRILQHEIDHLNGILIIDKEPYVNHRS